MHQGWKKHLLLFVILVTITCAAEINKVRAAFSHLKPPFLMGLDDGLDGWAKSGSTVVGEQKISLTRTNSGSSGGLWTSMPYNGKTWQMDTTFHISGPAQNNGDGLALWYVEKPGTNGKAFGCQEKWKGLAVFIRTGDNPKKNGLQAVQVTINDGSKSFLSVGDMSSIERATAQISMRNTKRDIQLRIVYVNSTIIGLTDAFSQGSSASKPKSDEKDRIDKIRRIQRQMGIVDQDDLLEERPEDLYKLTEIFRVPNVQLPPGYHFGITASSIQASDTHEISSVWISTASGYYTMEEDIPINITQQKEQPSKQTKDVPSSQQQQQQQGDRKLTYREKQRLERERKEKEEKEEREQIFREERLKQFQDRKLTEEEELKQIEEQRKQEEQQRAIEQRVLFEQQNPPEEIKIEPLSLDQNIGSAEMRSIFQQKLNQQDSKERENNEEFIRYLKVLIEASSQQQDPNKKELGKQQSDGMKVVEIAVKSMIGNLKNNLTKKSDEMIKSIQQTTTKEKEQYNQIEKQNQENLSKDKESQQNAALSREQRRSIRNKITTESRNFLERTKDQLFISRSFLSTKGQESHFLSRLFGLLLFAEFCYAMYLIIVSMRFENKQKKNF
ncbi:MAG: putative protein ERGIC-53 [Streblomastix strix]|uniref:L-type lectin-like domain-containing protein n=1 Tax=Streblomastix strix TaxID=222440 RepID=A0A5J4WPD4_9EUKA|nr:MAG: putative protein ERGIC-53 [Streblomastix strix]